MAFNFFCLFVLQKSFELASRKLAEDIAAGQSDLAALQTTVTYNLARCMEMLCLFDEAERLYKGILHEKQNYIDCTLLSAKYSNHSVDSFMRSLPMLIAILPTCI